MRIIFIPFHPTISIVTFNVIGYPSAPTNTFGVSINGVITKLVADETTFPVWKGVVPTATSSVSYQYVELNAAGTAVKTESFSRTLPKVDSTHSYNEFFERPTTKFALPPIPYTYLATWPSYTKIFNDDEIATIHVTADAAQMATLNANPTASSKDIPDIRVTFRWIDHNEIYTQYNISFINSGKSSKEHRKQAWRFDFDTDYNQTFFSRPHVKLRSGASDPTMLREKTYIDLLNSAGIPTQQGQYVRLFVNNQPYGLFLMVDDIRKSFIKQTIHGGYPSIVSGSMVQTSKTSTPPLHLTPSPTGTTPASTWMVFCAAWLSSTLRAPLTTTGGRDRTISCILTRPWARRASGSGSRRTLMAPWGTDTRARLYCRTRLG
ncbi:hypothetical protein BGZ90_004872, partial [Linnemannia elongata]